MTETGKRAVNASITDLGIKNATAHWNLDPDILANISVEKGQATLTTTGAININTGEFTGRSPLDRSHRLCHPCPPPDKHQEKGCRTASL